MSTYKLPLSQALNSSKNVLEKKRSPFYPERTSKGDGWRRINFRENCWRKKKLLILILHSLPSSGPTGLRGVSRKWVAPRCQWKLQRQLPKSSNSPTPDPRFGILSLKSMEVHQSPFPAGEKSNLPKFPSIFFFFVPVNHFFFKYRKAVSLEPITESNLTVNFTSKDRRDGTWWWGLTLHPRECGSRGDFLHSRRSFWWMILPVLVSLKISSNSVL